MLQYRAGWVASNLCHRGDLIRLDLEVVGRRSKLVEGGIVVGGVIVSHSVW